MLSIPYHCSLDDIWNFLRTGQGIWIVYVLPTKEERWQKLKNMFKNGLHQKSNIGLLKEITFKCLSGQRNLAH
jgi:hypothetical protein